MASKKHCDICDAVIGDVEQGGEIATTGYRNGLTETTDLCSAHYSAARGLLSSFKRFHQGGMVSWPQENDRIKTGIYRGK